MYIKYADTDKNCTDIITKPHAGLTLELKHMCLVGYNFDSSQGSGHHKFPELDQYDIGLHRGSFFLETTYYGSNNTMKKNPNEDKIKSDP